MFQEMLAMSSGGDIKGKTAHGTGTAASATTTITCGFKPSKVFILKNGTYLSTAWYDEEYSIDKAKYYTNAVGNVSSGITVTDNGFTFTDNLYTYWTSYEYIAIE